MSRAALRALARRTCPRAGSSPRRSPPYPLRRSLRHCSPLSSQHHPNATSSGTERPSYPDLQAPKAAANAHLKGAKSGKDGFVSSSRYLRALVDALRLSPGLFADGPPKAVGPQQKIPVRFSRVRRASFFF